MALPRLWLMLEWQAACLHAHNECRWEDTETVLRASLRAAQGASELIAGKVNHSSGTAAWLGEQLGLQKAQDQSGGYDGESCTTG